MNFFNRIAHTFRQQSTLTILIVLNVVVFLVVNIGVSVFKLPLLDYLALPLNGQKFLTSFWTLFSFMFTHQDLWHLIGNMVIFYAFGQVFFILFQERKLLYVYVMSGLCGGGLLILMGQLFPESFGNTILIGASASVLGVGAVMLIYTPDYRLYLFGVVEIRYKYLFLFIFIVDTFLELSTNTGGKISHMGGTAFGLLYAYNLKRGNDFLNLRLRFRRKKELTIVHDTRPVRPSQTQSSGTSDEDKMNFLLDKISKSGYESLTKNEKEELHRLSQKK